MVKILEEEILTVKIHPVRINNEPGLEIRKAWTICEANLPFLKELLQSSFSEKPLVAKIKIEFTDKLKTQLKLQEIGLTKEFVEYFYEPNSKGIIDKIDLSKIPLLNKIGKNSEKQQLSKQ